MRNILLLLFLLPTALLAQEVKNFGPVGPGNGAWRGAQYFWDLDYPFAPLDADKMIEIKAMLERVPEESSFDNLPESVFNQWENIGPFGAATNGGTGALYSGRIRYIEITNANKVRVGAASGGLWEFDTKNFFSAKPLSENINSEWIGAFATHPQNDQIIFVGTGEVSQRAGTGMWKTTNGGQSWTSIAFIGGIPSRFYALKFDPINPSNIHAATQNGYYRSVNGGVTFSRITTGSFSNNISDVEVDPINPNNIYIAARGDRIFKSTNGGQTFLPLSNGPTVNFGRTSLAICHKDPKVLYALVAKGSNNETEGIYKTLNAGQNWIKCSLGISLGGAPLTNIHASQGYYNNIIEVSPHDCNLVLAGGVMLTRATNGLTFNQVSTPHVDQHAVAFDPVDPNIVYVGCDGGMYYSTSKGALWRSGNMSKLPVTQYQTIAKAKKSHYVMGGTQDNGVSNWINNRWEVARSGDAGGVAISPANENWRFATTGVFSQGIPFVPSKTHNNGQNWTGSSTGIDTNCGEWYTSVRVSDHWPFLTYTSCDGIVYESTDLANLWKEINTTPFPDRVRNLTVSRGLVPDVYATIEGGAPIAMRWDGPSRTWKNITLGLAGNSYIQKIIPHTVDSMVIFALIGGIPSTGFGRKVYKSTDRGDNWTNISGDHPNVSLTDMIINPKNDLALYTSSAFGCFKSTNGGANWIRWNAGLPASISISEMDYVDSTAINGRVWVYFSTYGRGMWKREVSGDDANTSVLNHHTSGSKIVNAIFNQSTSTLNLDLQIAIPGHQFISVIDLNGKSVAKIERTFSSSGRKQVQMNLSSCASGIYIVHRNGSDLDNRRKIAIVR